MPKAAHILLIEDDTSLAANLCDVLKEDGFKVTVCHRGDEGLRRACNDECDVVLTDLRLPGLGGWNSCGNFTKLSRACPSC
jgi:DNA-binding response OmpR family regulator